MHTVISNDLLSVSVDGMKLIGEDEVGVIFDEAGRSASLLSNAKEMYAERVIKAVATGTSLNGFTLVCGYVEKLMVGGNVVSEVSTLARPPIPRFSLNTASQIHPWASLAWSILSAIPQVCP